MSASPPIAVVIVSRDPGQASHWAAMLGPEEFRVWTDSADLPDGVLPDVTVTDSDPTSGQEDPSREPSARGSAELSAVLRVGSVAACDATLPVDFTARELRLACSLLAQIARLRRRQFEGQGLVERLRAEALTDPLTGLPNRRAWDRTLHARLLEARGSPRRLCAAMLDVDRLKEINDQHGHPAGDDVLRQSGAVIRGGLRGDDFVARLGGDEFGMLLWVPDEETAARVVERVRRAIPAALQSRGQPSTTASAGCHVLPQLPVAGDMATSGNAPAVPQPSPSEVLAAADAALRKAKQSGRDAAKGGS